MLAVKRLPFVTGDSAVLGKTNNFYEACGVFFYFKTDKLGIAVTSTPQKNKVIKLAMGDVSVPGKSGQQFPSAHESYSLAVDADKNAITITGQSLPMIHSEKIKRHSFWRVPC